jgi:glutathione S-transferase
VIAATGGLCRYCRPIAATLYWFPVSHPAHAVRKMLDLKGIDYDLVGVLPGTQRVHLRLAGFRGGTVPALRLDGRRVQGTPAIARALERLRPDPPLFPADPERRARAKEVERWADEELQQMPHRILRWGLVRHAHLRTWVGEASSVPAPGVASALGVPAAWYYARAVDADEAAVRRALEELPATLDRVDALLADGTLSAETPDAAAFEVLCSVRALDGIADIHDRVAQHPSAAVARRLFPDWPDPVPPFLPRDWLPRS